ncbi:MAG: hypothetical protein ABS43_00900 [Bordetella sp. SCN 67-23]|nr:TetR/AcrR family transcriptional regulator [Burkholderiales bacterium]ODS76429.1 MAG: hypothetical protein ABS43_00900 [Bordetella sp. SCN 67-23]OJW86834.1 MAG: hypothetical protein BGO71_26205 [Burkholderiales bacterium 67-32]
MSMARTRNAEKTRRAIVDAARHEFSHKGFASARMESIARAAGVTKELIYHYFRGKEDIFNEVRALQHADALAASKADDSMLAAADPLAQPELLFVWRFHRALSNLEWVRFLTWEAAQGEETGIPGEAERERTIQRSIGAIKAAQGDHRLADDLDPQLLQLAVFALANYPLAYAQITRMATGRSPSDPGFRKDWAAFLAKLGQKLLAVPQDGPSRPSNASD